jgi:hypothetical protein
MENSTPNSAVKRFFDSLDYLVVAGSGCPDFHADVKCSSYKHE